MAYTREEYDELSPEQRRAYSQGGLATPQGAPGTAPLAPSPAGFVGPTQGPAPSAPAPSAAPAPAPWQREQFRDTWMSTGTDVNRQNQLLSQYNLTADKAGRVRLPSGETIDLRIGAKKGQNLAGWTRVKGQGAKTGQAQGAGGGGGLSPQTFGASPAVGAPAAAAAAGTGGGLDDAFRQQLLRLLKGSEGPIDPTTDPNLAPQAAAYRRARERAAAQERASAAERAAFTGLNLGGQGSGSFDTQIQGIREGAGEDIADYEAGLVGQEQQARRQQLIQALDLANSVGARTEANALQSQLADLDRQLQYSRLGESGRQFDVGTREQGRQFDVGLGERRRQFDVGTDYDYDRLAYDADREALLYGLG